jgi:hypothetical protein
MSEWRIRGRSWTPHLMRVADAIIVISKKGRKAGDGTVIDSALKY